MNFLTIGNYRINIDKILYYEVTNGATCIWFADNTSITLQMKIEEFDKLIESRGIILNWNK